MRLTFFLATTADFFIAAMCVPLRVFGVVLPRGPSARVLGWEGDDLPGCLASTHGMLARSSQQKVCTSSRVLKLREHDVVSHCLKWRQQRCNDCIVLCFQPGVRDPIVGACFLFLRFAGPGNHDVVGLYFSQRFDVRVPTTSLGFS